MRNFHQWPSVVFLITLYSKNRKEFPFFINEKLSHFFSFKIFFNFLFLFLHLSIKIELTSLESFTETVTNYNRMMQNPNSREASHA